MMNRSLAWMLVLVMIIVAAPAFSMKASHTWTCEVDVEVDEEEIEAMAKKWLETAKQQEGGENIVVYVRFPIADNATGDSDMIFEIVLPTFEEWGRFWDNYHESPASDVEEDAVEAGIYCPDSSVWEVFKVE